MSKYITITVLSVVAVPGVAKTATTAAQRPVTKEIAPGTILVIDNADEAQELIDLGAIRKATADDTKNTHVESLTDLTQEQKQAAAVDQARVDRENTEENVRREKLAQEALDAAKTPAAKTPAAKTAAAKAAEAKAAKTAEDAAAADAKAAEDAAAAAAAEAAAQDKADDENDGLV